MQARVEAIKNQLQPMSAHKSPVTCHVLIASTGIPGKNVAVKIEQLIRPLPTSRSYQRRKQTNDDGRCPTLLPANHQIEKGIYRVTFETKKYFESQGQACFYPYVQIVFELSNTEQHYHIPLLISPYSYTTYRGS
ncbi:unnamed protein product [Umbelopsis vinacea]